MTARIYDFDVVAFDADDTLWQSEDSFNRAERRFAELVGPHCPVGVDVDEALQHRARGQPCRTSDLDDQHVGPFGALRDRTHDPGGQRAPVGVARGEDGHPRGEEAHHAPELFGIEHGGSD